MRCATSRSTLRLACCTRGSLEIVRKRRDIGLLKLRQTGRQLAIRGIHRTVHQRIGILRKYLVIEKIIVIEKEKISRPVRCRSWTVGVVDLRNAGVEDARSRREPRAGARSRSSMPAPRGARSCRCCTAPGLRPATAGFACKSFACVNVCKSYRAPRLRASRSETRIVSCRKCRVLVRVRMSDGGSEALQIIVRDLMRVGSQRSEFQTGLPESRR
jgi:hypothetical protein